MPPWLWPIRLNLLILPAELARMLSSWAISASPRLAELSKALIFGT